MLWFLSARLNGSLHSASAEHNGFSAWIGARQVTQSRLVHAFQNLRKWPRHPIAVLAEAIEPFAGRRPAGLISVISRGGCYLRTPDTLQAGAVVQLRIECGGTVIETQARVAHVVAGDGVGLAFVGINQQGVEILESWIGELAVRTAPATRNAEPNDTTIDTGPHRAFEVFYVQRNCVPVHVATAQNLEQAKQRTAALASRNPGRYVVMGCDRRIVARLNTIIEGSLVWE